MDFDLDDEQQMLADSARAFLRRECGPAARRAQLAADPEWKGRPRWTDFAELGWLGVLVPEEYGGLSGDLVSAMALMEVFGETLVVSPFLESSVLCARLLQALGAEDQKRAWLPKMAAGEAVLALACAEAGAEDPWTPATTRAVATGAGYALHGEKTAVAFGAAADRWLVTAVQADGQTPSVWLVDPSAAGVSIDAWRAIDGAPMADIRLEGVIVPASARLAAGPAAPALRAARSAAIAAACVEAVGAMTQLYALTLDYAKVRRQFGSAIGEFQVIQHRLVDMFTKVELARPLAWLAATQAASEAPDDLLLSAAKAQIAESCRYVGEQAMQLHGGIGMTDEAEASHYFKRLTRLEKRAGDRGLHLGVLARALSEDRPTIYA